jgi:serine/threonine-protein kinase
MAEVFLGHLVGIEGFRKPVVIKSVRPDLAPDAEFTSMLLNEARLAALSRHPNLVHVLDLLFDRGRHWVVMEQVEGFTVHALLRRASLQKTRISPGVACRIACSVLSGLSHAHQLTDADKQPLGMVHRDISPNNIVVTTSGDVKLIDFGIAKASLGAIKGVSTVNTGAGQFKGTSAYVSPEQLRGGLLDGRSDVFSLAIVLWEMLTTARLFRRRSESETLVAITKEPAPPPSARVPGLPPALDQILGRALAKDTSDRYASAEEMREDLEEVMWAQRWRASPLAVQREVEALTRGGAEFPIGEADTAKRKHAESGPHTRSDTEPGELPAVPAAAEPDEVGEEEYTPAPIEVMPAPSKPGRLRTRKRVLVWAALAAIVLAGALLLHLYHLL